MLLSHITCIAPSCTNQRLGIEAEGHPSWAEQNRLNSVTIYHLTSANLLKTVALKVFSNSKFEIIQKFVDLQHKQEQKSQDYVSVIPQIRVTPSRRGVTPYVMKFGPGTLSFNAMCSSPIRPLD